MGDKQAVMAEVDIKRATDGTTYSYVKKKGRKKLTWEFHLRREKGVELREFIKVCYASDVKIVDHNNNTWTGKLINNPFELETTGRAGPDYLMPRGEKQIITIEFEGIQQ